MTHVSEIMKEDLLDRMMEEGYVRTQTHPVLPLTIYNYTQTVIHDDLWNSATLACRGLILDDERTVVARPFAKFFNLGDHAQPQFVVSDYPAQIFDKLDGSLGILYEYEGHVSVATRGSFDSDQSRWATEWLHNEAFGEELEPFRFWPEGVTPLVEIIYPENRIVVDYKGKEDLVMLGAINIKDGTDLFFGEIQDWWTGTMARQFPEMGIQDVTPTVNADGHEGEEGVVMVWFKPGEESHRLKVKRADYVHLHRIVTGMTARRVWEMCKAGDDIEEILSAGVPEEFYDWVRAKELEFKSAHVKRMQQMIQKFQQLSQREDLMKNNGRSIDRKKFAMAVKKSKDKGHMFALLDNKDIYGKLWDELYPAHEVPFGNPEELG